MTLATAVLSSICEYHKIVLGDLSKNGTLCRKVLYECITGPSVRDCSQLTMLADLLPARRKTVYASAKEREKLEETQQIRPFMDRLCRKPPTGDSVISPEWKLATGSFYELDCVSEIIKGHHKIFKVS